MIRFRKSGFSGGVAPHDPYPLVALEIVAEVAQVAFVLPPERDVPAVDHFVAQVGALGLGLTQVHLLGHIAVFGPFLEFPEGLFAVFGLTGAGAGGGVHPFQFPAEDIPHLFRLRVVIVYALLPFLEEVHVVSFVDVDAAPVHLHDRIAHAVQEVAVVGDHEKGAPAVLEVAFQEFDGVDVQVVRGLVHDVEVGLGGKHLREGYALDFPAGKVFHGLVRVREAELGEQLVHPQFVLPQVLRVQVPGPLGRCVHDLGEDTFFRIVGVFLFQEGDADVFEEEHFSAAVRGVFPGQDLQEGSFSGAVGGDQGHFVAFVDIESDMLEQHLGAVTLGNVLDLQVTCHNYLQRYKLIRFFVSL